MENNVNNIKVYLNVEITDEDINDIMTSALEGGINYWCRKVEIVGNCLGECASEHLSKGGEIRLFSDGDVRGKDNHILNKSLLIYGIQLYLVNGNVSCLSVRNGKINIDPGCIDGNAADTIIQYAVFNGIFFA